jgi:hypothetical protein
VLYSHMASIWMYISSAHVSELCRPRPSPNYNEIAISAPCGPSASIAIARCQTAQLKLLPSFGFMSALLVCDCAVRVGWRWVAHSKFGCYPTVFCQFMTIVGRPLAASTGGGCSLSVVRSIPHRLRCMALSLLPSSTHAQRLPNIGPALSRRRSPLRWRNFGLSFISNQGRTIALRADARTHHWSGDPPLLSGILSSTSWHDTSGAMFLVLRRVKLITPAMPKFVSNISRRRPQLATAK